MRPTRVAALAAAAVCVATGADPQPGAAQGVRISPGSAGWIGVNVSVVEEHGPGARVDSRVVIRSVVDGSPADRARLRSGDVILRLNGRPASFQGFARLARELRPGDRFELTLGRDGARWEGWERTVTLQAAPRPAAEMVGVPAEIVDRLDSMLHRMDSAVARLSGARSIRTSFPLSGTAHMVAQGPDSSRTFVLYPTADTAAVSRFEVRVRPTGAPAPSGTAPTPGTSGMVVRVRATDGTAAPPLPPQDVPGGIRVMSRATPREMETATQMFDVRARPLMPYIVGQNRVAGAELAPLNTGLAAYVQVERGLLVTSVAEGTPAAEAGLRPGDAVVRLGETELVSLEDLRTALARIGGGGLTLDVVRRGRRLRITLPSR